MRLLAVSFNYLGISIVTCVWNSLYALVSSLVNCLNFLFLGRLHSRFPCLLYYFGSRDVIFYTLLKEALVVFWANTPWMSQIFASKHRGLCKPSKGQAALLSEGPRLGCHLMVSFGSKKWLLRNTSSAPLEIDPLWLWVIPDDGSKDIYSSFKRWLTGFWPTGGCLWKTIRFCFLQIWISGLSKQLMIFLFKIHPGRERTRPALGEGRVYC